MRKASQDGGDSISITSGLENEIKRVGAGLLKSKKNSIKRKVQNFSHESDDGVVEPLLQKDKERTECGKPSAKFLLSRSKTESPSEKEEDQDTLLGDTKSDVPSMSSVPGITDSQIVANRKDFQTVKSHTGAMLTYNHTMSSQDEPRSVTPKTQTLIEISSNRPKTYSPSPLIFTTAKIHMDGKTKSMEPVQVTPVPILSTIEGNTVKNHSVDKNTPTESYRAHNASKNILDMKSGIKDEVLVSEFSNLSRVPSCKDTVSTVFEIKKPNTQTTSMIYTTENDTKTSSANNLKKCTKVNEMDTQLKESSIKVSSSQSSHSTVMEINKSFKTENDMKYKPTSSTAMHADNAACNGKVKTPLVVSGVIREIDIDVNKNIQSVFSASSQKPDTSNNQLLESTAKEPPNTATQNKMDINLSSSLGNKQLQRQKHTIDESKKTDAIDKTSGPDYLKSSDVPKCIDNGTKFKENFQTKDTKSNLSENTKTTIGANLLSSAKIVDNTNNIKKINKTTAVSSIPVPSTNMKSSEQDLGLVASEKSSKSIVTKSLLTDTKHTTTTGPATIPKTSNTTILSKPSLNITSDTSSNTSTPVISTPASNSKKASTCRNIDTKTGFDERAATTVTSTNVAKTLTTASTKSVINSERTIDNANNTHKQSSAAARLPIDQSVKHSNKNTVAKPTTTKSSIPTGTQSKTSTVTTMKSSTAKSSNLTKSSSKSVTTTAVPSTSSNTR